MPFHTYALTFTALLLVSCASTTSDYAGQDISPEGRLFGDYLAGSYASFVEDAEARSTYYNRAFSHTRDDLVLGRRALISAISAGELDQARSLAYEMQFQDRSEPSSRVVLGVDAFRRKKYDEAEAYFAQDTADLTIGLGLSLMRVWTAYAKGETDQALSLLSDMEQIPFLTNLAKLQTAKINANLGAVDVADAGFNDLLERNFAATEVSLSRFRALYDAGQEDTAGEFLSTFSDESGTFETGPIRDYLDTLANGGTPDVKLTLQEEASRTLTETALSVFAANRALDAAEVFLRMALELDPNHDKAKIFLASIFVNGDRRDEALAMYQSVSKSSPYYVTAQLSSTDIHFFNEEDAKALSCLLYTSPSPRDQRGSRMPSSA